MLKLNAQKNPFYFKDLKVLSDTCKTNAINEIDRHYLQLFQKKNVIYNKMPLMAVVKVEQLSLLNIKNNAR